ncbi:MAG: FG-GAP-like repeat-containing protein [Pyrinomonadaceae bacterium]
MHTNRRLLFVLMGLLLPCLGLLFAPPRSGRAARQQAAKDAQTATRSAAFERREEAYRANNLGVALLEQFKYKEGAEAFRRSLKIEPGLTLARINLGIALYNVPELDESLRESKSAAEQAPDAPQPYYIMGLIAKSQNRTEDAIVAFERVLQLDGRDTGANINLGQLLVQQRKYPEAMKAFRTALAAEPYNATATYNLATALLRSGQREDGQALMGRFQKLREGGYGSSIGQNYLEQGRYAEAMASTGAEPELVNEATPEVTFADASIGMVNVAPAGKKVPPKKGLEALSGVVTLFDYDADSRLDLLTADGGTLKLYHNEKGQLVDVTARASLTNLSAGSVVLSAVAGDYDNDERPDLFLMSYPAGGILYHNDGEGRFSDKTKEAEIAAYGALSLSTAFVDADHDGDLDIFIAGFVDPAKPVRKEGDAASNPTPRWTQDFDAAPNMLLRNNGNGKFTDVTDIAQLTAAGKTIAVVPSDYDNRRDVDLVLARQADQPILLAICATALFAMRRATPALKWAAKFQRWLPAMSIRTATRTFLRSRECSRLLGFERRSRAIQNKRRARGHHERERRAVN